MQWSPEANKRSTNSWYCLTVHNTETLKATITSFTSLIKISDLHTMCYIAPQAMPTLTRHWDFHSSYSYYQAQLCSSIDSSSHERKVRCEYTLIEYRKLLNVKIQLCHCPWMGSPRSNPYFPLLARPLPPPNLLLIALPSSQKRRAPIRSRLSIEWVLDHLSHLSVKV